MGYQQILLPSSLLSSHLSSLLPSPLGCHVTHSLRGAGWFDFNHIRRFVLGNILNRVGLVKRRMLRSLPHFWGHTRVAQQILKCSCARVCVCTCTFMYHEEQLAVTRSVTQLLLYLPIAFPTSVLVIFLRLACRNRALAAHCRRRWLK